MNVRLSDAQRAIVEFASPSAIQVLASAGSGKTRVLTERVRFLLARSKAEGVIALTFTNKAADELTTRLSEAGLDIDRVWVGTIHSIAQRILQQYGYTIGLPTDLQIFERDKDRMEVFLESLRDEDVDIDAYLNVDDPKEKRSREGILQSYLDGFSVIKRELLSEDDVVHRLSDQGDIWRVYVDYQRALANSGGIDYDDILRFSLEILLTQSWVGDVYRAKFRHICLDEAQDLNRVQYEFICALAGTDIKSIMMVGDPDQMIYGFNGSSSDFLCERFVQDFPVTKFKLVENYRSSRAVIRLANKLRPRSQQESEFALEGFAKIEEFQTEGDEADWIVESIQKILELRSHPDIEGPLQLSNMVVIARNRFVFGVLIERLRSAGIDFSLRVGERSSAPVSLFGKVLDYAVRVKVNSKDWVNGRGLCDTLSLDAPDPWDGSNLLDRLALEVRSRSDRKYAIISDTLRAVADLDSENPNILKLVMDLEGTLNEQAISEQEDGNRLEYERSLDELRDFSESWLRFRSLGLGNSLSGFRSASALGKLNSDTGGSGLNLSTVHTMKGLEKDIVFLMGLCEGVFPDYRAKSLEKIDEERNAVFVAVTRARRWLFISYPRVRMMPWKDLRAQLPSRFVTEMQS